MEWLSKYKFVFILPQSCVVVGLISKCNHQCDVECDHWEEMCDWECNDRDRYDLECNDRDRCNLECDDQDGCDLGCDDQDGAQSGV